MSYFVMNIFLIVITLILVRFVDGESYILPNTDTSDPLYQDNGFLDISWVDPGPYSSLNTVPLYTILDEVTTPQVIHPYYRELEGVDAGVGVYDMVIQLTLKMNPANSASFVPSPRCNRLFYLDTPGPNNTQVSVLMAVGIWSFCNTTRKNILGGPYCRIKVETQKNDYDGKVRGVSALSYDGGSTWNIGAYDPRLARCNAGTVTVKIPNTDVSLVCLLGGNMLSYGDDDFINQLPYPTDSNVCSYDGLVWFDISRFPIPSHGVSPTSVNDTIIAFGGIDYVNTSLSVVSVSESLSDCSLFLHNRESRLSACINITQWLPMSPPPWITAGRGLRLAPILQYFPYGLTAQGGALDTVSQALLWTGGGYQPLVNSIEPDRTLWILLIDQLEHLTAKTRSLPHNTSEIIEVQWTLMGGSIPLDTTPSYHLSVTLYGNLSASDGLFPPNGVDEEFSNRPPFGLFLSSTGVYLSVSPNQDLSMQWTSVRSMNLQKSRFPNRVGSTYGQFTPNPDFARENGFLFDIVDMIVGFDPKVPWRIPVLYVFTELRLVAGYTGRCIFQKCIQGKQYPVPCQQSSWDASCADCSICPTSQYILSKCKYQLIASSRNPIVQDTVCANCTSCEATGRITLAPCTSSQDTVCGLSYLFFTDIDNILSSSLRLLFDYLFGGISVVFLLSSVGLLGHYYSTAQKDIIIRKVQVGAKLRDYYNASTGIYGNPSLSTDTRTFYPGWGSRIPNLAIPPVSHTHHLMRLLENGPAAPVPVSSTVTVEPNSLRMDNLDIDILPVSTTTIIENISEDSGPNINTATTTSRTDSITGSTSGASSVTETALVPVQRPLSALVSPRSTLSLSSSSSSSSFDITTSTSSSDTYPDPFSVPSSPWSILCGSGDLRIKYYASQLCLVSTYLGCLYSIGHWCLAFALPLASDVRGGVHSEGYAIIATSLLWMWGVCGFLSVSGIGYILYRETREGRIRGDMEFQNVAKLLEERNIREAFLITLICTVIHPRCIYLGYFLPLPPKVMKQLEHYAMIITGICEVINLSLVLVIGNWLSIPVARWGRLLSTCALLGVVFVFVSVLQILTSKYTSSLRRVVWVPSFPVSSNGDSVSSTSDEDETSSTASIPSNISGRSKLSSDTSPTEKKSSILQSSSKHSTSIEKDSTAADHTSTVRYNPIAARWTKQDRAVAVQQSIQSWGEQLSNNRDTNINTENDDTRNTNTNNQPVVLPVNTIPNVLNPVRASRVSQITNAASVSTTGVLQYGIVNRISFTSLNGEDILEVLPTSTQDTIINTSSSQYYVMNSFEISTKAVRKASILSTRIPEQSSVPTIMDGPNSSLIHRIDEVSNEDSSSGSRSGGSSSSSNSSSSSSSSSSSVDAKNRHDSEKHSSNPSNEGENNHRTNTSTTTTRSTYPNLRISLSFTSVDNYMLNSSEITDIPIREVIIEEDNVINTAGVSNPPSSSSLSSSSSSSVLVSGSSSRENKRTSTNSTVLSKNESTVIPLNDEECKEYTKH